jgi:hypothetical protein
VLAVDARFAELVALGLLLGLTAFRALVWGPAVEAAAPTARGRAAEAGRRAYWRALWAVVGLAGVAEPAVVVVKAALLFGSGVWGSVMTPAAAERLVAASRFGDLLGLRGGLCTRSPRWRSGRGRARRRPPARHAPRPAGAATRPRWRR